MKKGFTIVELLIVMAVIAAILSAIVPVGVNAIRRAKATAVALNLSQISQAVMSEFYLEHNNSLSIQSIKTYFPKKMWKVLKRYELKTVNSTVTRVYIWYVPDDVAASEVESVFPAVEASGTHPMLCMTMKRYW